MKLADRTGLKGRVHVNYVQLAGFCRNPLDGVQGGTVCYGFVTVLTIIKAGLVYRIAF